jgi:hypothetical protein
VEVRRQSTQSGTNYYNIGTSVANEKRVSGSTYYYNGSAWIFGDLRTGAYNLQWGFNYTQDRVFKVDTRYLATSNVLGITNDTKNL